MAGPEYKPNTDSKAFAPNHHILRAPFFITQFLLMSQQLRSYSIGKQSSQDLMPPATQNPTPYLKASIFVDRATSELGHNRQCGHIHVLVREEKEVYTAALGHTLFGQSLIGTCLGLEQSLGGSRKKCSHFSALSLFEGINVTWDT